MLAEYVRKSGNLPLNIVVDVPFDVVGRQLLEFWSIMLKIWSVNQRWRSLSIITTLDNFSRIHNNLGCRTPERLESLKLYISKGDFPTSILPTLPFMALPALKSLVPHRMSLIVSDFPSLLNRMENLDISASTAAILMHLAEHFNTYSLGTREIPRLRHLSLRNGVPRLHGTSGALVESYISSLTTLTLENISHYGLQSLHRLLRPPLLEELSLTNLTDTSWHVFAVVLGDMQLTFPALCALKLSFITQCTIHAYFSIVFPALEHLSLLHVDANTFLSALLKSEPIAAASQPGAR
jgi:hypothetical protein